MSKECKQCKQTKEYSMFSKEKLAKDGYRNVCKECRALTKKERGYSFDGVITATYSNQRGNSKRRNDIMPTYTRNELHKWCISDTKYMTLFNDWIESGYEKDLKPSIDRLDDYKGYSFDNIQVMTWKENNNRYDQDIKNGINTKRCRAIKRISKDGEVVEYYSVSEAIRQNGRYVIDGLRARSSMAKGYIWKYID